MNYSIAKEPNTIKNSGNVTIGPSKNTKRKHVLNLIDLFEKKPIMDERVNEKIEKQMEQLNLEIDLAKNTKSVKKELNEKIKREMDTTKHDNVGDEISIGYKKKNIIKDTSTTILKKKQIIEKTIVKDIATIVPEKKKRILLDKPKQKVIEVDTIKENKIKKILLDKPTILSCEKTNIHTIYHMADIHINNCDRFGEEYDNVFLNVYNEIKKDTKNALIVICGDIFETDEADQYALMRVNTFLLNLTNILPVILIPGNHDVKPYLPNEPSMLETVCKIARIKNLHYLKNSGLYQYNDIMFVHASIYDNFILDSNLIKTNLKKICLYHGTVKNKYKTYGNHDRNELYYDVKDFNFYCSMFGDIHSHYFLDEQETIGYAGSLIQQTIKESVENHGFIKWDVRGNIPVGDFIKIKSNYGIIKVILKDNKIVSPVDKRTKTFSELPKNINVQIVYFNCTNDFVDDIEEELKNKYNVIELTSQYKVINDDIQREKTLDIETNIRNYIYELHKANADVAILQEKMVKKYDDTYCQIKIPQYKNVKIQLIKLQFSNTCSFGKNNVINFDFDGHIISIIGDNGNGKSTLIEVITISIFADGLRVKSMKKNILNVNEEYYDIILYIKIGKRTYKIDRKYTARPNPNDDKIFIVNDDNTEQLFCEGTSDCKKAMINLLNGMKLDHFIFGCLMPQYKTRDILDLQPAGRINLMSYFCELEHFAVLNDISKNTIKTLDKKIIEYTTKSNLLATHLYYLDKKSEDFIKKTTEKKKFDDEAKNMKKVLFEERMFFNLTSRDGVISNYISYYAEELDIQMNTLLLDFGICTKITLSNIGDDFDEEDNNDSELITPMNKTGNANKPSKKCNIAINKIDKHTGLQAFSCGGFERFMINLTFKISLTKLSRKPLPSMLIIDEALSCINNETEDKLKKLFKMLTKNYDKIFVISHNANVHNYSDYIIGISKINNVSKIAYCRKK